ncbi:hypothetical protein [Nocardia vulneris]|uniref:Uncharacterized protein n=1 Tax=Nocardia vulneris TaxID=1141657 RepID=A0ABR4ZCF5_9NOCA|nr:hypothetical protein [Nocardia vulneris]KIA63035.1 hypothetical protein FG87_21995 [Nocardia vulneris]
MSDELDEAFNLVDIARNLRRLESTGGRAALELKRLRVQQADAKKALRQAKAAARAAAPRSSDKARSEWVDDQTNEVQYQAELAEIEVKYGADMVEERRSERSSLQTRAKLAIEAMRLSGYGGDGA